MEECVTVKALTEERTIMYTHLTKVYSKFNSNNLSTIPPLVQYGNMEELVRMNGQLVNSVVGRIPHQDTHGKQLNKDHQGLVTPDCLITTTGERQYSQTSHKFLWFSIFSKYCCTITSKQIQTLQLC